MPGYGKYRREHVAELLKSNLHRLSSGTSPVPLPVLIDGLRELVEGMHASFLHDGLPALLLEGKEVSVLAHCDDDSLLVTCSGFGGTAGCLGQFVW